MPRQSDADCPSRRPDLDEPVAAEERRAVSEVEDGGARLFVAKIAAPRRDAVGVAREIEACVERGVRRFFGARIKLGVVRLEEEAIDVIAGDTRGQIAPSRGG